MRAEATGFLYPFIDSEEDDPGRLAADLAASAEAKMAESASLAAATLEGLGPALDRAAAAMAEGFRSGGRLFCFGNGGSATDATAAARLFAAPPPGRPLPAWDLTSSPAILTALANDVGFELVFARQLMAHGRSGDIALAFSTSGNSANLLEAVAEARRRGMTTVAICGTGGGKLAASADVDHCLTVQSQSVHRIQESQRSVLVDLKARVAEKLEHGAENQRTEEN